MTRTDPAPRFYLVAALLASVLLGVYAGAAALRDGAAADAALRLWSFVVTVLLAGWIVADSRGRAGVPAPFCFGFLAFCFALPYAPYYLFRTRGRRGLLWIPGAIALFGICFIAGFLLPLLVNWAI